MRFDLKQFAIVIGVILVSTVLHEMAHGGVAYLLGDETARKEGRLSLNPFRHIDPIMSIAVPVVLYLMGGPIFGGAKPVPVDSKNLKWGPWGMALVALAGPLTNLILALLAFLIGYWTGALEVISGSLYYSSANVWSTIFVQMAGTNLGFFVFNMIPFPPLDGSRLLYAIAPDGARRVLEYMETYGIFLVLILVWVLGGALTQVMGSVTGGILNVFIKLVGG